MTRSEQDTWEVYDQSLPFAGARYGVHAVRMVVVGLGGDALLVVSPGVPCSEARWEQVARWGKPRFLLAPNHFHNWGIRAWKDRFPDATVVAHPRAQRRLRRKLPGIPLEDLSVLEAALPRGVRLLSPPMARQGETWVSAPTPEGTAWFVTDGILNLTHLPPGLLRVVFWLLGYRTGLMTNPLFKRAFLTDQAAYKAWVEAELDRDRPVLFVPSHGTVLRGNEVSDRLRGVTRVA